MFLIGMNADDLNQKINVFMRYCTYSSTSHWSLKKIFGKIINEFHLVNIMIATMTFQYLIINNKWDTGNTIQNI